MAEYIVERAHWGVKGEARHRYQPGEVREIEQAEAADLLRWEVLAPRLPQLDHDGDGKPGGSLPRKGKAAD